MFRYAGSTRLAICETGRLSTIEYEVHQLFNGSVIDCLVRFVRFKSIVEYKGLSLHNLGEVHFCFRFV